MFTVCLSSGRERKADLYVTGSTGDAVLSLGSVTCQAGSVTVTTSATFPFGVRKKKHGYLLVLLDLLHGFSFCFFLPFLVVFLFEFYILKKLKKTVYIWKIQTNILMPRTPKYNTIKIIFFNWLKTYKCCFDNWNI